MVLRLPLALHHNYSIMEVALFSALHFPLLLHSRRMWPPLWLWVVVLFQFMAALLSMAGSSRPYTAAADAIFFRSGGLEIAVYEGKVHFKRPPYKAEVLDWFNGGSNTVFQEGPVPQDTDCSCTSNSGYLVSRGSRLSWYCTLRMQPVILPHPSVGTCLLHPGPPALAAFSTTEVNEIAEFHHLWGSVRHTLSGSWKCGTFHTHPLHCSALLIHWEVNWQSGSNCNTANRETDPICKWYRRVLQVPAF